ncbi:acyl transferase/acyl hydrolase/lysophospholipase [Bisporella sp. PMI_857]|nr:acyl transferase/acyl hydrolase/lysophospholipase [Bisporella sp. PMI_857]
MTEEERAAKARKDENRQILSLRMKNAGNLKQWADAAKELDILEGNESWKYDLDSLEYNVELLQSRLKQLDEARINCDVKRMLSLVRTALSRDLAGMDNIQLYKHTHIGTKDLIERYIDSTVDTIRALVQTSKHAMPDGMGPKDIMEQVVYARQAFGRSALLLSGGATFGMNHVGVLKALFEAKLLPRIISGASAGSIVCAVLCTRTDEEIPAVLEEFPYGDLAVFEESDNEESVLERVRRLLTQGVWIDIKHLKRVMRDLLGDITFQEAYNRTRRILNICVSSASVYELPRLLNYVTAPNVMIWSAVAASCSVPFLFTAAELLVKNPITGESSSWNPTPQHWIDGSVDNDLPMTRLAEMFNVNHFIVSQVNPHVVPFLTKDEKAIVKEAQGDSGPGWVQTLAHLARHEALHRMHMLAELGIFPNLVTKARSVLSQKYSGDITILPEINYKDFPRMLKNPTSEFMVSTCLSGERATWPKLSRIRNRCAVELELDAAVQKLRARVVFSPSQVDLRRMTTGSVRGNTRRLGRAGRDSDTAVAAGQSSDNEEDDENVHNSRQSVSRPPSIGPSRASSTRFLRPYIPPLPAPRSSHGTPFHRTPAQTPGPDGSFQPLAFPFPKIIDNFLPDSSAGETAYSVQSSDADVDSLTDDSTPDASDTITPSQRRYIAVHLSGKEEAVIDFFSSSQPITSPTDHVLATSPASTRTKIPAIPITSKIDGKRLPNWQSLSMPPSPEAKHRKLSIPNASFTTIPK